MHIADLRLLQRKLGKHINNRIDVLIEIKKREKEGISKRALSAITGDNHYSIVKWRKMHLQDGIDASWKHGGSGDFKPSVFYAAEYQALKALFHDLKNGMRGY